MTVSKTQMILVSACCLALMILALALGHSWGRDDRNSSTLVPSKPSDPLAMPAESPTAVVGDMPANQPAGTAAAINGAKSPVKIDLIDWSQLKNGCVIEQVDASIHIVGMNTVDGYGHENGVVSSAEYPVQDFEVSTDFMMPRFRGTGSQLVILQAREANLSQITLQYYVNGNSYVLRWWTNSGEAFAKSTRAKFGDENRTFHRLKLKYDAATHVATGYADDKLVSTVEFELKSNVRFMLAAATSKAGNDMNVTFDHPTLLLSGVPAQGEKLP